MSIVLLSALLGGCYSESDYGGDGQLVDRGWSAANDRYVLDLGPVGGNEATYHLKKLPAMEMTVGFVLVGKGGDCLADSKPINPMVETYLLSEAGEEVISEAALLREWVWSESTLCDGAFLYRAGESVEKAVGDGTTTFERVQIKASEGWGTYFTPMRNASYRLRVKVFPAPTGSYSLRVVAKSGGWK